MREEKEYRRNNIRTNWRKIKINKGTGKMRSRTENGNR
jgi:hypothetical protein